MKGFTARLGGILMAGLAACAQAVPAPAAPAYAIAMHGEPKYPADFKHLDYVDPQAPKAAAPSSACLAPSTVSIR